MVSNAKHLAQTWHIVSIQQVSGKMKVSFEDGK
jgi:hypothetical protein